MRGESVGWLKTIQPNVDNTCTGGREEEERGREGERFRWRAMDITSDKGAKEGMLLYDFQLIASLSGIGSSPQGLLYTRQHGFGFGPRPTELRLRSSALF